MSQSEPLPISEHGTNKEQDLCEDFDRLLSARAEAFARQRGAARIDDADFTSAYRELLTSENRGWQYWLIKLIASVLILGAGLCLSSGISDWGGTTNYPKALVGLGAALAAFGLVLQHVPFRFTR